MKFRQLIGTFAGFGLLFSGSGAIALSSAGAVVAAPQSNMEMPHGSTGNQGFDRIEQPLGVKLGVGAAVVSLIGLELWWFLLSKPKSYKARSQQGIQEVDVVVEGGYEPNRIVVQAGQPIRLNFLRKDPSSCLEEIRIPDFQIVKTLPLNQKTAIEFTPQQPGDYTFTCGMNMFRGVIQVTSPERQQNTLAAVTPNAAKAATR